MKGREDVGDGFVFVDAGKAESRMVINGDMERFSASAFIAIGAIAGTADAGFVKGAEFFHIEVDECAGFFVFVADHRRWGRRELGEVVETIAFKDAVDGGL